MKIIEDLLCPLCGAHLEVEITGHDLLGCPVAKAAWSICGIKIQKRCIEHEHFVYIVEVLHQKFDSDDFKFLGLWLRQNT